VSFVIVENKQFYALRTFTGSYECKKTIFVEMAVWISQGCSVDILKV